MKMQITQVIVNGADALIYYLDGKSIKTVKKPLNQIEISKMESSLDVNETKGWKQEYNDFEFKNIVVKLADIQYK
ncbi:hypothetical protein [Bacillus thuringiensis]|uniref:hypothetical protein n=1 Tax=Bacillus thuringiensis TaxID=1428 RepID=UPI0021D672E6|nr:hypothetical protein [Bacillus thuringiensis]MCU7667459.1 hypothetical protein [Bacillus thuringiensis]